MSDGAPSARRGGLLPVCSRTLPWQQNFGEPFEIPDLGPIGISAGLAHPRHFVSPTAQYDADTAVRAAPHELIMKYGGELFNGPMRGSPFDVVAWYGDDVTTTTRLAEDDPTRDAL